MSYDRIVPLNIFCFLRARSEQDNGNGKELLVKMMEVFVLKFKTVSKLQLPILMSKHKPPPPPPVSPPSIQATAAPLTPGAPTLMPLPSPATPGNPQTPATPATPDVKTEPDIKPAPSPAPSTASNAPQVIYCFKNSYY